MGQKWRTTVNLIPNEPFPTTTKVEKLRLAINAEIAALNDATEKLEGEVTRLKGIDPMGFTDADIAKAQAIPRARLDLQRREVVLRRRIESEWFPARAVERKAER